MLFSVTTQFQGTAWCSCNAFVWRGDEKVVISDIDGTITRSDVRGMILPKIGKGHVIVNYQECKKKSYFHSLMTLLQI